MRDNNDWTTLIHACRDKYIVENCVTEPHTNFLIHNINGDKIYTDLHSHGRIGKKAEIYFFSVCFPFSFFFFIATFIE